MSDYDTLIKIEEHVRAISSLLGIPVTESNQDTPHRVAKMYYNELFKNRNGMNIEELNASMKLFKCEGTSDSITIKGIKFSSVCEHHWMPFMGEASVMYVPNENIIGLSKIPRVVKYFSCRPQLQERLTNDIGLYLTNLLKPRYLRVELVATHTCVMCRGAESECETRTVYTFM